MIRITIESDAEEGTIEMTTKWCRDPPTGPGPNPLPEEAVASFTVNPVGYLVYLVDTSTAGNPITAWSWRIEGPAGTVATSSEQNPVIDLAAEGPDDYDIFLSVYAGGDWSDEAVDSVTLTAPVTDDDVAWGYPFTTSSNFTDERLAVPIIRARDNLGAELVSPAQVELTIKEDDVIVYGPSVKTWGTDLGTITDPGGDYLFAGTLEEGGTLSFDSQGPPVNKYKVKLVTQGANPGTHEIEFQNPGHPLFYTRGTPPGNSIGVGSSNILPGGPAVPTYWAQADVENWSHLLDQYPQRLRMSDADIYTTDIATRKTTYPNITGFLTLRPDLAYYGGSNGDPNNSWLRPNEAWGSTTFPHPTLIMGDTPRSGRLWSDTVNYLAQPANGAWQQNAINKTQTRDGTTDTLTCPYNIYFDVPTKTWSVRENRMRLAYEPWLDLYTDAIIAWRSASGCEGFHVHPVKIQWAAPNAPTNIEQLWKWLYQNSNPGWDVASDSGGSRIPSWGAAREFWDYANTTVLETLEASWEIVRMIRDKDPTARILYDPFYLNVGFSSGNQTHYEQQYVIKYGGNAAAAKNNYTTRIKEMAFLATDIMFPIEADVPTLLPNDYISLSDRDEIRKLDQENKWIRYPQFPQTNIA